LLVLLNINMLSIEKSFLFIELPKTGSTSICSVLEKYSKNIQPKKHITPLQLKRFNKLHNIRLSELFKFTFVRNPFDRLVSAFLYDINMYNYRPLPERERLFHLYGANGKPGAEEFKSFVRNDLNRVMQRVFFYREQICWSLEYDFVGRYERINIDYEQVCNRINIPVEGLPWLNNNNKPHYSTFYTDTETIEVVADLYRRDLNRYNYTFDDKRPT
tara:strand:- start:7753 stop:8400 length:648 start_codon:yes stop_codon:yes gene_type:complete